MTDDQTDTLETKRNIQSALEKLSKKKLILEAQRDELLLQVDALTEGIAGVRVEYGAIYNTTVSPIAALPNETLCTIFQDAVDIIDSSADDVIPGKARDRVILAISHVCKAWRDTSLALPNLWTTFTFHDKDDWRVAQDRFHTYLQRSGTLLLLEFNFDFTYPGVPKVDSATEAGRAALLEATIPYVVRWRKLSVLVMSENLFTKWVTQLIPLAAPNLECFCLHPFDFFDDDPLDDIQSAIFKGGAPKLSSVYVNDINPLTCLPPLTAITTLHFDCPHVFRGWFTWEGFLKIAAIPSLRHLSILGYMISTNVNAPSPVFMSNLQELEVGRDEEFADALLMNLVAPSLTILWLRRVRLPRFLPNGKPFPNLKRLTLTQIHWELDPEYFQRFAFKTSLVQELSIKDENEYAAPPPYAMLSTAEGAHLWPRLRQVTFQLREWAQMDFYCDFILSRNAIGLPIKTMFLPTSLLEAWKAEKGLSKILDFTSAISDADET